MAAITLILAIIRGVLILAGITGFSWSYISGQNAKKAGSETKSQAINDLSRIAQNENIDETTREEARQALIEISGGNGDGGEEDGGFFDGIFQGIGSNVAAIVIGGVAVAALLRGRR